MVAMECSLSWLRTRRCPERPTHTYATRSKSTEGDKIKGEEEKEEKEKGKSNKKR
jgi:hypothetical protein